MGPQISARQMDRILDYIESGKQEGARAAGRRRARHRGRQGQGLLRQADDLRRCAPADEDRARGDLRAGACSAIRFRDADEAIRIANGTIYGLAAAVWTRDIKLAHRDGGGDQGRQSSGSIPTTRSIPASPFGGYKQSGFGRDLGQYALEQYTNVKSVWVAL